MNRAPLAIDLFCGLGGWTEGLLAEGYDVIGFDIEQHVYGDTRYPAQLVVQDVLTLHGSQFRNADLIVASPPCQAYSYRAMPWKRAKALPPPDNTLFESCFRIQREACEAGGRHIPLIVENVRGAQKWVGRARWNYGSFYLWGDVPALMPGRVYSHKSKYGKICLSPEEWSRVQQGEVVAHPHSGMKVPSQSGRRADVGNGARFTSRDCGAEVAEGRKGTRAGAEWFDQNHCALSSKSPARKAASAMIAKIPEPLARHIARSFKPLEMARAA